MSEGIDPHHALKLFNTLAPSTKAILANAGLPIKNKHGELNWFDDLDEKAVWEIRQNFRRQLSLWADWYSVVLPRGWESIIQAKIDEDEARGERGEVMLNRGVKALFFAVVDMLENGANNAKARPLGKLYQMSQRIEDQGYDVAIEEPAA